MSYVGQSVHHTILVGASIVLAPDGLLLGTVLAQEIKSYSSVVSNTETVPDQNTGTRETARRGMPTGKWWHVPAKDRVYLPGGGDEHIWRFDHDLWQRDQHDV